MFRQLFLNFSHLLQNVLLLGLRRDFLNEIRQKCTKYTFEKGKEINFAVLFSIYLALTVFHLCKRDVIRLLIYI